MENEDEEQVSEGSTEWESIHYSRLRLQSSQAHHRSLSDSQTQLNGWSMVAIRDSHLDDEDHRSIIFPPINHEGLHISFTPASSLYNSDDQRKGHKSSYTPCEDNELVPSSPPPMSSDTRSVVGEAARLVGFGLELLRSKVTGIASSLRHFAAFRGTNWSFSSATGVAAALLVWWLYMAVRRRRRHFGVRKESRDHLILLIKEKDEKINQLLHQIAQMNQLLLALHRDSLSGTGR